MDARHGFDHYLPRWRSVGYEAVEVSLRKVADRDGFLRFLRHSSLSWIPQIFSNDFVPGGSVRGHLDFLRHQMEECLDHGSLFFSAHSGSDNWNLAGAEDFYGQALVLEKQVGVPVSRATHRLRYFATPRQARPILQ